MSAAERKRWQIAIQVIAGGAGLFIFLFYPSCFFWSVRFFTTPWERFDTIIKTSSYAKTKTATERRGDLQVASWEEGKQMPEETSLKLWCLVVVVAIIMMIINMDPD